MWNLLKAKPSNLDLLHVVAMSVDWDPWCVHDSSTYFKGSELNVWCQDQSWALLLLFLIFQLARIVLSLSSSAPTLPSHIHPAVLNHELSLLSFLLLLLDWVVFPLSFPCIPPHRFRTEIQETAPCSPQYRSPVGDIWVFFTITITVVRQIRMSTSSTVVWAWRQTCAKRGKVHRVWRRTLLTISGIQSYKWSYFKLFTVVSLCGWQKLTYPQQAIHQ